MRRQLAKVADGWVPLTHGTPSSYNRGCRCDDCKSAHLARMRRGRGSQKLREKRKAERIDVGGRLVHPSPYSGHGTVTAYTSCGCRCQPCFDAMSAYNRERRRSDAS